VDIFYKKKNTSSRPVLLLGQCFGGFLNAFEIMLVRSKQERINALIHFYIYETTDNKQAILDSLSTQEKDMYQLK
jgi:surfactin synthase thioesterase subunit